MQRVLGWSGLAIALWGTPLAAESRVVSPGLEYERGELHQWLFGRNWRPLWTTPIEIPELDLDRVAGGLRPEQVVGGFQTLGLAMRGADGRSYTFRSINKRVDRRLPGWLRWGPLQAVFRDQGSASLPAAPVVAARLSDRIGLWTVEHRLVVMPDDPALGRFRSRFADRVGTLREYPTVGPGGTPGTFGVTEIVSTAELWQRSRAGTAGAIDSREYLRARLLDWFMGDWDRHPEQWRWGRVGGEPWRPIPEDHDQAFSQYEGVLLAAVRPFAPRLVRLDRPPSARGLTQNGRHLDAWLLAGLDRRAWEREIAAFRERVTPAAIEQAVAALPESWRRLAGDELQQHLQRRRETIPPMAMDVYESLARAVHLYGTDADDHVAIRCGDDGVLRVEIRSSQAGPEPRRRRVLRPEETRRVEIHPFGGRDRVSAAGAERCPIGVKLHRPEAWLGLERGVPAPARPGYRMPGRGSPYSDSRS